MLFTFAFLPKQFILFSYGLLMLLTHCFKAKYGLVHYGMYYEYVWRKIKKNSNFNSLFFYFPTMLHQVYLKKTMIFTLAWS